MRNVETTPPVVTSCLVHEFQTELADVVGAAEDNSCEEEVEEGDGVVVAHPLDLGNTPSSEAPV